MRSLYSIFPAQCVWPQAIDDVRGASHGATEIRLVSGARNLEALQQCGSLKALWCFDIDAGALNKICECSSLESLYVENIKTDDFSLLGKLNRLKILSLDTCLRVVSLSDLRELKSLSGLALTHFKNVHALDPLGDLQQLTALAVSGSMWTRMRVTSFEPLGQLQQLGLLRLTNIKAENESLAPLSTLTNLKHLEIANFYPMREFARLSRKLGSTECAWFRPFVEVTSTTCTQCGGTKVMLTGSRKPTVCPRCDRGKLEKHTHEWEEAVRDAA